MNREGERQSGKAAHLGRANLFLAPKYPLSYGDSEPIMAIRDIYEAIEFLKSEGEAVLRRFARSNRGVSYAQLRF